MRIFILVRKDDDYSSLPEGQKIFIYDAVTNEPDLVSTMQTLDLLFESAAEDDRIVFNGPSWLIAIAGHCWLQWRETSLGILLYDNKTKTYTEHNDAY